MLRLVDFCSIPEGIQFGSLQEYTNNVICHMCVDFWQKLPCLLTQHEQFRSFQLALN